MILTIVFSTLSLIVLGIILFIKYYPAFGAKQSVADREKMSALPNHDGKKFNNIHPIKEHFTREDYSKMIREMWKGNPKKRPSQELPLKKWTKQDLLALDNNKTTAIWLGHSALFLKMAGKYILIDPMLGKRPSPVKGVVGKRFNSTTPITAEDLPEIDLVVLTHDHYDHLDYGTIKLLKDKSKAFLTPSGVSKHLLKWGVDKKKVTELYWEESTTIAGIKFTSKPTQHFSGRGPGDRMHTLWCAYVIEHGQEKIFFSGDSGYFDGFKKIGKQHGPFDICFMECGQYNELWPDYHMFPEETAQASLDIQAKKLVPIHWGAFPLSTHDWDDPIKRVKTAALALNIELEIPQLGEPIVIKNEEMAF